MRIKIRNDSRPWYRPRRSWGKRGRYRLPCSLRRALRPRGSLPEQSRRISLTSLASGPRHAAWQRLWPFCYRFRQSFKWLCGLALQLSEGGAFARPCLERTWEGGSQGLGNAQPRWGRTGQAKDLSRDLQFCCFAFTSRERCPARIDVVWGRCVGGPLRRPGFCPGHARSGTRRRAPGRRVSTCR